MSARVAARVRRIVAMQFGVPRKTLSQETRLCDLGCDTLDRFEIVSELGQIYDIDVGGEDGWTTVGDIAAAVRQAMDLREVLTA